MKPTICLLFVCLWLGAVTSHVISDEQVGFIHCEYEYYNNLFSILLQPNTIQNIAMCPLICRMSGSYNLPHFHSCSKYYRCWEGIYIELDCPGFEMFDHVTLECRHYDEARCLFDGPVLPE